jgi:drug/metabolite transporter (DMT)-like permease
MEERWVLEGLRKFTVLEPSFTETALFFLFFAAVMCLFVLGLSIKSLLWGKVKDSEAQTDEVDAVLTWAMLITGSFMILCGFFILFTGIE